MKGIIYCVLLCICTSHYALCQGAETFYFDVNKGAEIGMGDFIQLKDGTIIKGDIQTFKLGLGILNKAGTVTLNNKAYDANDIAVFQVDSSYYLKAPGIKHFMQRKKAGKINLYYQYFRQLGNRQDYELNFLQKGSNGEVKKFSVKLLAEMVADNEKSMTFIQEFKKAKIKNQGGLLDKAIDAYNHE